MMNIAPADLVETHPINLGLFKFVPNLRAGQLVQSLVNTKSTILDPKLVIHKLVRLCFLNLPLYGGNKETNYMVAS